jgi:hypothetical protein
MNNGNEWILIHKNMDGRVSRFTKFMRDADASAKPDHDEVKKIVSPDSNVAS